MVRRTICGWTLLGKAWQKDEPIALVIVLMVNESDDNRTVTLEYHPAPRGDTMAVMSRYPVPREVLSGAIALAEELAAGKVSPPEYPPDVLEPDEDGHEEPP